MELKEYKNRNKITITDTITILGTLLIVGTITLLIKLEELGIIK